MKGSLQVIARHSVPALFSRGTGFLSHWQMLDPHELCLLEAQDGEMQQWLYTSFSPFPFILGLTGRQVYPGSR